MLIRKLLLIFGLSLCQFTCHVSGCWWSFITSSDLQYLGIFMVFILSLKRDLSYNCKYNSMFMILSKHLSYMKYFILSFIEIQESYQSKLSPGCHLFIIHNVLDNLYNKKKIYNARNEKKTFFKNHINKNIVLFPDSLHVSTHCYYIERNVCRAQIVY